MPGLMRDDIAKKRNELFAGVTCGGFAEHFSGCRVQRRIQRQSSMAVIFKAMSFRPAWRKWKNGVQPIQCLNRRLFVHAKYGGMAGWIHVEPNNVGGFGFEIRIIRYHVTFESMRLQ